jgi:hypothetical protein
MIRVSFFGGAFSYMPAISCVAVRLSVDPIIILITGTDKSEFDLEQDNHSPIRRDADRDLNALYVRWMNSTSGVRSGDCTKILASSDVIHSSTMPDMPATVYERAHNTGMREWCTYLQSQFHGHICRPLPTESIFSVRRDDSGAFYDFLVFLISFCLPFTTAIVLLSLILDPANQILTKSLFSNASACLTFSHLS